MGLLLGDLDALIPQLHRRGGSVVRRLLLGLQFALLAGVLLAAVGAVGHVAGALGTHVVGATWLTTTLGPTGYVLLAHPHSVTSRLRNALMGHGAAVLVGLAALAVFGLWSAPSVAETHQESLPQVGAQAVAVAATLLVLTLADAHHAPAGATALLVASGIARPGPPLVGLLAGLAIVLIVAPLLARLPGERGDTATTDAEETPGLIARRASRTDRQATVSRYRGWWTSRRTPWVVRRSSGRT